MGKNRLGASQSTFLSFRNDLRNMHVSFGLNLRDRNELDVTKEKGGLKIIEEKFEAVSSLISDYIYVSRQAFFASTFVFVFNNDGFLGQPRPGHIMLGGFGVGGQMGTSGERL